MDHVLRGSGLHLDENITVLTMTLRAPVVGPGMYMYSLLSFLPYVISLPAAVIFLKRPGSSKKAFFASCRPERLQN